VFYTLSIYYTMFKSSHSQLLSYLHEGRVEQKLH